MHAYGFILKFSQIWQRWLVFDADCLCVPVISKTDQASAMQYAKANRRLALTYRGK